MALILGLLCIFILDRLSAKGYDFVHLLINMVYWAVMILSLIQAGVFLFSHYRHLYPRFFIAFTSICALFFLIIYSITVRTQFKVWESYQDYMGNPPGLKGFDPMSCFIGLHTWFLVPAVIQVLMHIFCIANSDRQLQKSLIKPEIIVF